MTASLADVKEISVDVPVATVSSELDNIFILKDEEGAALEAFPVDNLFFFFFFLPYSQLVLLS